MHVQGNANCMRTLNQSARKRLVSEYSLISLVTGTQDLEDIGRASWGMVQ